MLKFFNRKHILKLLHEFELGLQKTNNNLAFDRHCARYFKTNKSIGANDRRVIYDMVYNLMRHKLFLDAISPKPLSWECRLDSFNSENFVK